MQPNVDIAKGLTDNGTSVTAKVTVVVEFHPWTSDDRIDEQKVEENGDDDDYHGQVMKV